MTAAPAKINLYLHVLGKRDDGYHDLDSLIAFARLGDDVAVEAADEFSLEVRGPFAAALANESENGESDNLVLRAARLLAARTDRRTGARITLTKNLPVAAGLGGGSADAAATLKALSALWDVTLDDAAMATLSLELGADVPVCAAGQPSFVGGVGEKIDPAPALPAAWLVLVNPGTPLSTAKVFGARAAIYSEPGRFAASPADAAALAAILSERQNDLTDAAVTLEPRIGDVLEALNALPEALLVRMSGSGATCFAIMDGEISARARADSLARDHPGWWVAAAPLMT